MLNKPYGKCGSCKVRGKCCVQTETLAKVIECPYPEKFYQPASNSLKKVVKLVQK